MSHLKDRPSIIEKAKIKSQEAADKATQAVSDRTNKVTEQTQEQAEKIRASAFKQLDKQSTGVGKLAQNAVDDLEKLSVKLAIQGRPESADNASAAASLLSRISNYLLDSSADDIVADLEKLGKEPSGAASKGLSKGMSAISFLGDASVTSYREYWNPGKPKPSQPQQAAKLDKDYDLALDGTSSSALTDDIHLPGDAVKTKVKTAPTVKSTTTVKTPVKAKVATKPKATTKPAAKPKAATAKASTTVKATTVKATVTKATPAKSASRAPAKPKVATTAKAKTTPTAKAKTTPTAKAKEAPKN